MLLFVGRKGEKNLYSSVYFRTTRKDRAIFGKTKLQRRREMQKADLDYRNSLIEAALKSQPRS